MAQQQLRPIRRPNGETPDLGLVRKLQLLNIRAVRVRRVHGREGQIVRLVRDQPLEHDPPVRPGELRLRGSRGDDGPE
jgi:hypothetical protein